MGGFEAHPVLQSEIYGPCDKGIQMSISYRYRIVSPFFHDFSLQAKLRRTIEKKKMLSL